MLLPQGRYLHQQHRGLPQPTLLLLALQSHLHLVLSAVRRRLPQPILTFPPPMHHLQKLQHPPLHTPGSVTHTTTPAQVKPTTSSSQTISVAQTDQVPGIPASAIPFHTPTQMVQLPLQSLKFSETCKLHLTKKSFFSPAQIAEVPAVTYVPEHLPITASILPATQSSSLNSRCLMMEIRASMEICLQFGC